jgi:hypothetical protein
MAQGWKYILAKASDMSIMGELPARDRSLDVDLNKSGSAGFWIPTSVPHARDVYPWSTALLAQYNDIVYWSGLINSRSTSLAARRATCSAVSWFERLMHLYLQDMHTIYTNQDAGAIVTDLLAKAKVQAPDLYITMGTVETTQPRSITYGLDQNIGQAIIDLCNLESGYDWFIDPLTRKLNIVAKIGINRNGLSGTKKVSWTYIGDGKSSQSNLADVIENISEPPANQIFARGKYATGFAKDDFSISQYGVFQDPVSLSDVVDNNILLAYANADIVYRAQPRLTYDLTPKPSTKATVPRLFRDFNLGDTTYMTAKRDYVEVEDQATRIFGVSLAISNAGTETLSKLQTRES